MVLDLGFSTCPNDTFIFDAMVHGKVDTEGLEFNCILADVEELNRNAFEGSIDITKLSYHAYGHITGNYRLLNSGSALGYKNGPLLLSRHKVYPDEVSDLRVAIPGKFTTANLLFELFFPVVKEKKEYLFSDIEEAVLDGEMDAGLVIHESRFLYEAKGLQKIADLGELWEEQTGHPIPLGGIVIHRRIDEQVQRKVDRILKRSVEYAFANPASGYKFIKQHAQELDDKVIQQHIELYVNNFTQDLGEKGKAAIVDLYEKAALQNILPPVPEDIFVK